MIDTIKKYGSFKQENTLMKIIELQNLIKLESSTRELCEF
jgi:hypothetical protein